LAFACCSHAQALAAGLPSQDHQDHVCIITDSLFRFHNNELDELPRKLDSTEYARLFLTKSNPASSRQGLFCSNEEVEEHLEPKTWVWFLTHLCSRPENPANKFDDVSRSSHLYHVPGKTSYLAEKKKSKPVM